jgi:hypothetical protein
MDDLAKNVFRVVIYWVGLWYAIDLYSKLANAVLGE